MRWDCPFLVFSYYYWNDHGDAIHKLRAGTHHAASQIGAKGNTDHAKSLTLGQLVNAGKDDFQYLVLIGDPVLAGCLSMTRWVDIYPFPPLSSLKVRFCIVGYQGYAHA